MRYRRGVTCRSLDLFGFLVREETGAAFGCPQPACLARNLRVEAVKHMSLLVAAGMNDLLFHGFEAAASPTCRQIL